MSEIRSGGVPGADENPERVSGRLGSRPSREGSGGILAAEDSEGVAGRLGSRPSGRIVDLTLTLRDGMRGVSFEQAKSVERDGWNARTLHLYSHAGTHMDAQTHFGAGTGTIDRTPLQRCMGWAWVVSLDGLADKSLITVKHLGAVATKLAPGEALLLRTGWSQHVDQPQHYRDNFPRVADELAHWCVERQVNILGVEPPSVADVNNPEELTRIHKILLAANIIIVEGLTNLCALTREKVFFIAAPLKIENGDGCPCRAFAIEDWSGEWSGGIPAAQSTSHVTAGRLGSRPSKQ